MTVVNFGDHTPPEPPAGALDAVDAPEKGAVYPSPAKPMQVVRLLLNEVFNAGGHRDVVFWRGDWWRWTGTHWEAVDELDIIDPIYYRLEDVVFLRDGEKVEWSPTPAKVGNLLQPLQIQTRTPRNMTAPGWLSDDEPPAPADVYIPMRNGLLNREDRTLIPHTPTLFNTWSLDFDFDPAATCPTWEKFVTVTFQHDPFAVYTLQEWFGYIVTGGLEQQKGLMLIGPKRSGKGTIDRILKALIGAGNYTAASMQSLTNSFGLADWIGKPLAVLSDSRDGGAIPDPVVERLLSIIGQDAVPVEIKHKTNWVGTLPTRIMLVSNEMPSFRDSSGALVDRWLVIETAVSHLGNEDTTLGDRLAAELPGILLWALDGADRLRQQGRFTTPAGTAETMEMMHDAAAPEAMYIKEQYTVTGDPEDYEPLAEVYAGYQQWLDKRGNRPVSQTRFKAKVKAAGIPGVGPSKRGPRDGDRIEVIKGISKNF